jgi:hypothetical protein
MIPVMQTLTRVPEANCFAACVASILEVSIEAVPNFDGDDWYQRWNAWLRPRGLALLTWPASEGGWRPEGYSILGAESPRGDWAHAVVCLDGEIVHDPHPVGMGKVGKWRDWTVFMALDPAKIARTFDTPVATPNG